VSFKSKLDSKVGSFISSKRGKNGKGTAVQMHMTDLAKDLELLHNELLKKVCPTAVGYAATIVRKRAIANIKAGGGEDHIGMSRKVSSRNRSSGKSSAYATRSKWSKKVLKKRGKNFPSLADKGMIIKKNISRKEGGLMASQIVGPKYQSGQGKNFAHTFEPRDGQKSGAPNHKWWPRQSKKDLRLDRKIAAQSGRKERTTGQQGKPLKPLPFMRPAAEQTMGQQTNAIYKALKRWDIKMGEVNGTTGEF